MVGLTFLDLGAENGASSAPPALQDFFRGARQFFPGPPNFSPSMLCGSNFLQRFSKNGDTPQSGPSYQQPLLLPFPPCMSLFSLLWNSSTCSPCLTGSLRNSVASLWTPVAALQPWTQLVVSSPQPWPVLGNATYPQRRSRASSTGVPRSTRQLSSSSRPSVALQEANQGRRQQRKSLHLARTV